MLTSPRQRWPFPSEGQNPWFEAFEAMVNAMDASGYASREDRHIVLMDGGTLTFSATTGVLSWSSAIELSALITGFRWTIPAGSLVLADGEIFYVDLVRGPTSNVALTAKKASQVPSSDAACFLCVRRGDRLYWRDGQILKSGVSGPILSDLAIPAPIVLALNESTGSASFVEVGAFPLSSAGLPSIKFKTVALVSGGGLTGEMQLYNLTDAAEAALLTYTETTPTAKISSALSLPNTEKMYQVRIRLSIGAGTTTLFWAGFDFS